LAKKNVDFNIESQQLTFIDEKNNLEVHEPKLMIGDARNLFFLHDNSIDLICAHPPYANIIHYTDAKEGDLSFFDIDNFAHPPYANIIHYTDAKEGDLSFFDIDNFLKEMLKVARESFRVLKPGRQCAILIGDTRRKKHVIPLGFKLINTSDLF